MIPSHSLRLRPVLRPAGCLAALLLLALPSAPARATSMASHAVVLSLTLVSATYEDDGSDASGNLDGFGSSEVNVGPFEDGTGSQSGSASFTLNGSAPTDPEDFAFGVGDTVEATVMAEASADGVGSQFSRGEELVWFLEFEDFVDGSRNILLDFEWSYTQTFSLTNMADGDQAAAFFDATASIANFESYFDEVFFVVDENYGNTGAGTDMDELMDSDGFQLLMDVEEGGATASAVDVSVDVGANAIVNVPEPSALALLAAGLVSLGLAVRAPRPPRA